MAFCQNCGQQIPDNANACPYCGTFVNAGSQQQAPQQNYQQQSYQQDYQQDFQQQSYQQDYQQQNYQQAPQQGYGAPVNPVSVTPDQDVQQTKGLAWLSYMGPLFLIPMFVKKESPYCQFHVKQGATLCAVEIAYQITKAIIMAIINAIFPGYYLFYSYIHSTVYNIFDVLFWGGSIFLLVITIIGIVNAATGKKKELPLIGKIPWIANLLDKFYNKG